MHLVQRLESHDGPTELGQRGEWRFARGQPIGAGHGQPEQQAQPLMSSLDGPDEDDPRGKVAVPAEVQEAVRIVLLKDIPFQSHCEHHMAPIIGKAAIAYLPTNRVVGISKLARVLHAYARRLQIQERLTAEVAQCIWDELQPKGVAVVIEASHACMTARGVRTPGVNMVTSRIMGIFRRDEKSRQEVLKLMGY